MQTKKQLIKKVLEIIRDWKKDYGEECKTFDKLKLTGFDSLDFKVLKDKIKNLEDEDA